MHDCYFPMIDCKYSVMKGLRSVLALVLLLASVDIVFSKNELNLAPPTGSYKFLMLLPFGSPSHRNCFMSLAEGLADRGHQIVILSALPPRNKHPNIKELNHGVDYNILSGNKSLFEVREEDPTGGFSKFKEMLPKLMLEMYKNTEVMDLYKKRHEFDLIIIDELFNEVAYPFVEAKKFVFMGTAGIIPISSAVMGNVLLPSYTSFTKDYPRPFCFLHRIYSLFWHIFYPVYWRNLAVVPEVQKVASELFPNLPPLLEIERDGLVLILANSHFTFDAPIPRLPSQVEVGGMHCRPAKKLPKDLLEWIEGAGSNGVVYFSLGTVAKGFTLPEKYKSILVQAFGKLKQRVIWKFEEDFPGLPENVIVSKWLPQQDILAHANVKLFITHGGMLSMQEAVYHATPLLALPIFGDQPKNADRIKNKGFGTFLIWEELTVDKMFEAIQEIINNPMYQTAISEASVIYRDQPAKPLETAVWWLEYVVRNKGAPQLRSPAADLSWIEYLMLDVILLIHLIGFFVLWIIKKLYGCLCGVSSNKKNKKIKKKRE